MTNLLVITTLYPNLIQFRHGLFVETRLLRLVGGEERNAVVIAPVPWFPFTSRHFPKYSQYARVPAMEERGGITVYHPRYLVIPKIGMWLGPFFLALTIGFAARKVRRSGYDYDLIDAHYYYPDGVAVALASHFLAKPFTVTARGSDINLLAEFALPRRLIRWAAIRAAASITVSQALKDKLLSLGADEKKVHVFRNGVDLDHFVPMESVACKKKFGVGSCTLLSVGNLIELKGHHLIVQAMPFLPQCNLLIVGDGEMKPSLEALVASLGVRDRVRFLAAVHQPELVEIYNAAEILVLASAREGMPNVVLEAMACDTPVAATAVGGVPEIVCDPSAGVLIKNRDVESIVEGVTHLLANYPKKGLTRRFAESFSWDSTVAGLRALFDEIRA
jgi:glycosyltransferase involved in cell wall biosynthesis